MDTVAGTASPDAVSGGAATPARQLTISASAPANRSATSHRFHCLGARNVTAGLNPADIAVPIRAQFEGAPNVEVHLGAIDTIDLAHRCERRFLTWVWSYLFSKRGSRLITSPDWRMEP